MSLIKAQGAGDASTGFYPYTIGQSLRFEDGDSAYLYKTYGSSAGGDTSTWTFSVWLKIGDPNAQKVIWSGSAAGSGYATNLFYIQLRADAQSNRIDITWRQNSSTTRAMSTNRQFRDPNAWMHIVLACDTTQATDSNRLRLYINGTEETSFSTDDRSTISQSSALPINANSYDHAIGRSSYSASAYFDGYMAEINFVDGSQLAPTSFGETKAGIWIPKDYTGSHGTTGFYLPFDDSSALGDDESANTNDWTPSGFATTDVVPDSPTNNFCTLNPLDGNSPSNSYIKQGNLLVGDYVSTDAARTVGGTMAMRSGKWYFEICRTLARSDCRLGIIREDKFVGASSTGATGLSSGDYSYHVIYSGTLVVNGSSTSSWQGTLSDDDVFQVAYDADTGKVWFGINNTWGGSGDPANGSNPAATVDSYANYGYKPWIRVIGNALGYEEVTLNCGQDSTFAGVITAGGNADGNGIGDFKYAPPSGFSALCSANLPDPGIDPAQDEEPADYFDTQLWTGTGSGQSFSNFSFQPDWLWFKHRNGTSDHAIFDSVRGVNAGLSSNNSNTENTNASGSQDLVSFDSDGFTTGTPFQYGSLGSNTHTIVTWAWRGGGSAVTNEDGSISSSVSANTEAGFSIVGYTGNATAGATVGHGLSSTPELYIVKSRSLSTSWVTYHKDAAATPEDGYLVLNGTDAFFDTVVWNDTAPTSSVFSLGGTGYSSNNSGATYIAYCFHSVDGYSKVGSYESNNSTNGPFVYTGFKPAFILMKNTDRSAMAWVMFDNKRGPFNPNDESLTPSGTSAEPYDSNSDIDFLSNGFKLRGGSSSWNNYLTETYIYLAFAEQPFKYSNAE